MTHFIGVRNNKSTIKKGQSMINMIGVKVGGGGSSSPVYTWDTRALELFAQMSALGETPTDARKLNIDVTIKALKAAGLFDTQFEGLYFTRGTGLGSTKLNWIKDSYNLILRQSGGGSLNFVADIGYNPVGNACLSTEYQPSAIAGLYAQNDACFGMKLGGVYAGVSAYQGALNPPRTLFVQNVNRINSDASGGVTRVIGYNCLARNNAANFDQHYGVSTVNVASVSTGKSIDELVWLAAWNKGANSVTNPCATEILEIGWFGKYLSQAQFLALQTICDAYIAAL